MLYPRLNATLVNLGTGYETLGISKAGTIQSQLDVEPTVNMNNLLFLVRKLISNKLVEAFDWLSCQKSVFLSVFVQGQGQKSEQKHETKKLVEFHNQHTFINYDATPCQCRMTLQEYIQLFNILSYTLTPFESI